MLDERPEKFSHLSQIVQFNLVPKSLPGFCGESVENRIYCTCCNTNIHEHMLVKVLSGFLPGLVFNASIHEGWLRYLSCRRCFSPKNIVLLWHSDLCSCGMLLVPIFTMVKRLRKGSKQKVNAISNSPHRQITKR